MTDLEKLQAAEKSVTRSQNLIKSLVDTTLTRDGFIVMSDEDEDEDDGGDDD